jgi:poly-gamma-glutamate capsule biosynthesis protein CapA/YwtB (metallophosphatase superfamily)
MNGKSEKPSVRSFRNCEKAAVLALACLLFTVSAYVDVHAQVDTLNPSGPNSAHRDPSKELAMGITAPFTIAAVGDIIEPEPVSSRADPGFQALTGIIRSSDVGFANMESSLVDMHHRDQFQGPIAGTLAPKEVGADIKAMGITILNRANNHALDGDVAGMLSTDHILDELGIVHAGSGMNLDDARAASFLDTPKGRVGMVGMVSIDSENDDPGLEYIYMSATHRVGDMGGRPGVNPLRLTTYHLVTPEQMQMLKAFRDSYLGPAAAAAQGTGDTLHLFDESYKVGTPAGSRSYTINPQDEREILRSIRNGKVRSDFMIATIHAHHGEQNIDGVQTVSKFLIEFAHECIDNGADIFLAHGPHTLQGVEIYKGKPIFYGLSSFIFQTDLQFSYSTKDLLTAPGGDSVDMVTGNRSPLGALIPSSGMVATSHYERGRLVEIRLYPEYLGGFAARSGDTGIPTTPPPELARQILGQLQELSKPFGTKITVENNVGVIRVAAAEANQGKN